MCTPNYAFCKDDLMLVNWPKHIIKAKGKIKKVILLCLADSKAICFLLI